MHTDKDIATVRGHLFFINVLISIEKKKKRTFELIEQTVKILRILKGKT